MSQPVGFTWIDKPRLAAMAFPESANELAWLRKQGIEVVLSLSEEPPRRDWVNDAGLMLVHVPIADMEAPTPEQLERCLAAVRKAHERQLGVVVHCTAGLGRTGVIVACYFVTTGLAARDAINRVRRLRPGSIETSEQAAAVTEFARRQHEQPGES